MLSVMVIGILALQGDFEAHARMLERLGFKPEARPERRDPVPRSAAAPQSDFWRYVKTADDLHGIDGLILPGGESTTMLKFLEDQHFWDELKRFAVQAPVFGTCAGAILLASKVTRPPQRSLGALDATVVRNAYGRQIDSSIRYAPARLASANGHGRSDAPLEMVFIRAPQFARLAPGVEQLATESGLPVLVRQGNVLAATFHPELTTDTRVHELFVEMVRQHASSRARQTQ